MPLRCIDWPTGHVLLKQARLEGYRANSETEDLLADNSTEGTRATS